MIQAVLEQVLKSLSDTEQLITSLVCKTWLAPASTSGDNCCCANPTFESVHTPACCAGAAVTQIRPARSLSVTQLQRLRQVYPSVSSLCLRMSTSERQLGNLHGVFPSIASVRISYQAKAYHQDLGALLHFTGLQNLELLNLRCHLLSTVSKLTGLTSLSMQERYTERFLIQQSAPAVACVSTLCKLQHLQILGCPSAVCLQRLDCLVSLKLRGCIPAAAVPVLSGLTRLESNMIATPPTSQLSPAQLQLTLHKIQRLTTLRHLCLKVKLFNGLQHFLSLTNLTTLKLDTTSETFAGRFSDLQMLTDLSNLTVRFWPRYGFKNQRMMVKDALGFQIVRSIVLDDDLEFFGEKL